MSSLLQKKPHVNYNRGKTLYKAKIKATFKTNLNVAFNMSECDKKDTLF